MINKWISKTSSELNFQNAPRVYTALDDYDKINLKENITAYPSHGVNWVSLCSGSTSVFSDGIAVNFDDEINFPIPVSNKLWIKSLSDTTEIKILSTREVIEEEINFLISLEKIQSYFYTQLGKTIENNSVFENEHFNAKLVSEEDELKNTLEKIKSIVTGSKKSVPHVTTSKLNKQSVLYSTCQVIADHSRFKFEEPKHIDANETSSKNLLYAIAKSSKIRVRKIILRDVWWKEENGHLLAFTKQKNEPVALIQKTSNSYLIKNLATGSESVVSNEIVLHWNQLATCFFQDLMSK